MKADARVSLVRTDSRQRWLEACAASGQPITAFHTYSWLQVAAAMTDTKFVPLIATFGGTDVGVAPWLLRRRGPLSTVNWCPFPYLGPLVAPVALSGVASALRASALKAGAVLQQQCFSVGADVEVEVLRAQGFEVHVDRTLVVETRRPLSELWEGLESRCRTKVRKAEKEGVVLQEGADDAMSALATVVGAAFSARGLDSGYVGRFPPEHHELVGPDLRTRVVTARVGHRTVGCLVTLMHDDHALIWHGGVLPEARGTHANVLLYWDAVRWAQDNHAVDIDLVGLPDAGIERFKRQFGGTPRQYVVAKRVSRAWESAKRLANGEYWAALRGRRTPALD